MKKKKWKKLQKTIDKVQINNIRDIIKDEVIFELKRKLKSKRERQMANYELAVAWKRSQLARGQMTAEEFLNETKMKDYVDND